MGWAEGIRKDTVVFLSVYPLGTIFGESLGFERFEQAGYKLVYLDLSKMYYPETYRDYNAGNSEYVVKEDFFVECETKNQVIQYIKAYANRAWFFPVSVQFNIHLDKLWIERAFKKYGCDYILLDFFPVPSPPKATDKSLVLHFAAGFIRFLFNLKLGEIVRKCVSWGCFFLLARDIFFKKPAFCFVAGKISCDKFRMLFPSSTVVSVPSFDYYRYRVAASGQGHRGVDGIPGYDYVLYYDQSTFDSPDGRLLGISFMDRDLFFERINGFFDRVEKVAGKKVVIAGSPKRRYEGHEYNGREILYDLTPKLTYYADLILVHSTIAFNYAVCMNKPIIFVKMKEFAEITINAIHTFANYFEKRVLDMDEDFDQSSLNRYAQVDPVIYQRHVLDYLAQQEFSGPPTTIVVETLLKYDNPDKIGYELQVER